MMSTEIYLLTRTSNPEEISKAINWLCDFQPTSLNEYVIALFNKCLFLQWSERDDEFIAGLKELNNLIHSRLIDDSEAEEELFCDIAKLNYQIHNYKEAKTLLHKSLKQEKKPTTEANVEQRFRKRLLLSFCREYIALELRNIKDRRSSFRELLSFLAGIDLNKMIEREFVIKELLELGTYQEISINSIVNQLINVSVIDCSVDSVFSFIKTARDNLIITADTYTDWLIQIIHIVSHCLSEQYEKDAIGSNQSIFYKRLAEMLMKTLGDEYVTCYATIKMENNEYFSALSTLIDARNRLSENNCLSNKNSLIAEIDFYCWYFSVCAHYMNNDDVYKNSFHQYCKETNDPIAWTYYHILNLKQLLIDGFEQLSNMHVDERKKGQIDDAYKGFFTSKPRYMIHKEMFIEWEFLNSSYSIFVACYNICKRYNHDVDFQLDLYKLSTIILSNDSVHKKYKIPKSLRGNNGVFYIVDLDNCKFIFKGNKYLLASLCYELNISINLIKFKFLSELENTLKTLKNTANVLVFADNAFITEDMSFIRTIILFDANKTTKDKHNLYIDISNLTVEKETVIKKQYDSFYYEHESIDLISNKKTAIMLCSLFSAMEEHLQLLQKKLESHIISPVSQDIAFDFQYCHELRPIKLKPESKLNPGYIPDWENNFVSCYSREVVNKYIGTSLDYRYLQDQLGGYLHRIKYIFHFESSKKENNEIHLCAFKIRGYYDPVAKLIPGDQFIIQDKSTTQYGNGEPDFMYALKKLFSKTKFYRKNHSDCSKDGCYSQFSWVDIQKDNYYNALRGYLYSYLGVILDEKVFLLIQDEGGFNNNELGRSYLLCVFQAEETDQKLLSSVCATLRNTTSYLKEIDSKPISPKSNQCLLEELKKKLENELWSSTCNPFEEKYVFISYRSKNGTPKLCIPVYQDVVYLRNEFSHLFGIVIDKDCFDERFDENIHDFINNENCIGSFIYFSYDYLNGKNDGTDKCLEEMNLLIQKKKTNSNFFIIPVFLCEADEQFPSLMDLVSDVKEKSLQQKTPSYKEREKAINYILGIESSTDINTYFLNWEFNCRHLRTKLKTDGNFRKMLIKNGIKMETNKDE